MPDFAEPFAIQDIYFDRLRVCPMKNGLIRFILIRETERGWEALPYALVAAYPNVIQNMKDTAEGIGMGCVLRRGASH